MISGVMAARDAWIASNFPDGTEVEHDQCNGCDTWTVGERRCFCGNRRMYLEIGGNVVDGFYGYACAD